ERYRRLWRRLTEATRPARPGANAFHPRKGKVSESWRRKETGLEGFGPCGGCSAEGMDARRRARPSRTYGRQDVCTKSNPTRGPLSPAPVRVCLAFFLLHIPPAAGSQTRIDRLRGTESVCGPGQ